MCRSSKEDIPFKVVLRICNSNHTTPPHLHLPQRLLGAHTSRLGRVDDQRQFMARSRSAPSRIHLLPACSKHPQS
jgi:hypothetical protein